MDGLAPRWIIRLSQVVFIAAVGGVAGCGTPSKQTWADWAATNKRDSVAQAAPHDAPHLALPPTPQAPKPSNDWTIAPPYKVGDSASAGHGFDLAMRHPEFPRTYIEAVHIDLTAPNRWVQIKWAGPKSADAPTGPWQSTIGRGAEGFDCNDDRDSNTIDSFCTPKGVFFVSGFSDHLRLSRACEYATWVVYAPRYIAMHSHHDLPREPASSGCVRMPFEAAKLIHNNSIVGVTLVSITGTWVRPARSARKE